MPWNLIIALVLIVVSTAITLLTAKGPPPAPDPATLKDFNFPRIEEGTPQAVVFGDVWLESWQVLWYGNLSTSPIAAPGGGGKK